jgi:hypothetical protein
MIRPVVSLLRRMVTLLGCLAASLGALPGAAVAQPSESGVVSAGEVEIGVETFGFAGVVRAGEYAGIRLSLTDRTDRVRAAAVRLHLRDADGDTALYERIVTLNPGVTQGVWLYARLPFDFQPTDVLQVTVREVQTDGDSDALRIGRQIGVARIAPNRVIDPGDALIGLIGRSRAGLDQYGVSVPTSNLPPTSHEWIRIAQLEPERLDGSMPDMWLGLAALETIIWTGGDPSLLRLEAVEALREWVYGGGRLVIVLPPVGGEWANAAANPLADLMPEARIERREGVSLEPYRALLTESERLPMPDSAVVHTFQIAPGTPVDRATPILAAPDGAPVVVRRIVGAGMVTLVGLDVADRDLATRLDAQRFWHRVLGYRFDVLSPPEMEELRSGRTGANFTLRDQSWIDGDFGRQIDKTGRAGVGVLLGLAVFAAYLVIAGPGGFGLLKWRNKQRHAWVAFVLTTGLFSVVAWAGARAIRPATVEITHLTLLDHVYGQGLQRARSWFSVLLPTYGEQTVAVGDGTESGVWTQAIGPWAAPEFGAGSTFPDARDYVIEARDPASVTVPTRSTVKEFQADWKGAPRWRMPLPQGGEIRLLEDGALEGVLTHDLPAALEDVVVVLVERQFPLEDRGEGGPILARTRSWRLASSWAPGDALPLDALGAADVTGEYFEALAGSGQALGGGFAGESLDPRFLPRRLEMLAFHDVLPPPDYRSMRGTRMIRQRVAHGWDLSAWFTQPALIVLGQVVDAESPVPLRVDGREVLTRGRTLVRWVYPLPAEPPAYPAPSAGAR